MDEIIKQCNKSIIYRGKAYQCIKILFNKHLVLLVGPWWWVAQYKIEQINRFILPKIKS